MYQLMMNSKILLREVYNHVVDLRCTFSFHHHEGDSMIKIIRASILHKKSRKFWYIRYQVIFNNTVTNHEITSKVLTTEKDLLYMKETYLPYWIQSKEESLNKSKTHTTTFLYYAELHIADCKEYRDFYNMHKRAERIIEKFGDLEIDSITELDIEIWINSLRNNATHIELSKTTRKKYLTTFNKIFTLARKDKAIAVNFVENINIRGKKKNKNATNTFTKEEVHLLLEKSKDKKYGDMLYPYLGLVLSTGLSPSEAIALKEGDIHFDTTSNTSILSINKSITKNTVGETKNEYRHRDIVLRKQAMQYIDILVKLAKSRSTEWLFSSKNGSRLKDIVDIRGTKEYYNKNTGKKEHSNSKWYKLLEDLELEYRPLKNCRHTFTMAMLESKEATATSISSTLGHNSINMLVNHYAKDIGGKAMEINGDTVLY